MPCHGRSLHIQKEHYRHSVSRSKWGGFPALPATVLLNPWIQDFQAAPQNPAISSRSPCRSTMGHFAPRRGPLPNCFRACGSLQHRSLRRRVVQKSSDLVRFVAMHDLQEEKGIVRGLYACAASHVGREHLAVRRVACNPCTHMDAHQYLLLISSKT